MTANLADLLARAAEAAPDQVAVVEPAGDGAQERRVTWRELDEAVSAMAGGLGEQGLVAGNRVLVVVGNRLEFVVAYLGILRALLVAVPVNPRSTTGELLRCATDSGARFVLADDRTVADVRTVLAALSEARDGLDEERRGRTVVPRLGVLDAPAEAGETSWADLVAGSEAQLPEARDAESLAVLLYTSGASARPRAAMLTHRALLANIEQAAQVQPPTVRPGDVVYGVLPLFHVYGLNAVLGQVLRHRATLLLVDSFDPQRALEDIERHHVTVLPVAPAVLAHWNSVPDLAAQLPERLRGVRTLMCGSAPLAPELALAITERTGLTVHQGYGLTEAAPVVTSTLCSVEPDQPKPGSVGAALPGVRLRLLDDTGAEPDGADPGEIHVAGDNLFSGYWPDGADGPEDGWVGTGDVGYLDADGDLFLVDRLKEIVIVSGFNVYPVEIEEVLAEVPGVIQAAVVGVPDPLTGEAVVAYLRSSSTDPDDVADLQARARQACERALARFKQPVRVEVVDQLPYTVTGKVAKGRLRAAQRRIRLGLVE